MLALLLTVREIAESVKVAAMAVLVKWGLMSMLVKIGAMLILKKLAAIALLLKYGVMVMGVKHGLIAEALKMCATVMGIKMAAVAVLMSVTKAAFHSMAPARPHDLSPPRIDQSPTEGVVSSPPSLAHADTCVCVCVCVCAVAGSMIEVRPRRACGFSVRVLLVGLPHRAWRAPRAIFDPVTRCPIAPGVPPEPCLTL